MIEIRSQLGRLKLDDLAAIVQQIYLALYAECAPGGVLFDPDREWTPDTVALVASVLAEYGLKPTSRHTVACGTATRAAAGGTNGR